MTTTNRAFIKVYRHDAAEPALPARAAAVDRQQPIAVGASIAYVAAATDVRANSASAQRNAARVAGSIDVMPPVARSFVDSTLAYTIAPQPVQRVADNPPAPKSPLSKPAKPATPHNRRQSPKRPLSSYIARSHAFESIARNDGVESLRPGTVVASFRWPAVCRALSTQCRAELDNVVDKLLAHADEGERTAGLFSLYRGQGCTSVLAALAARLAIRKRKVLLVDGNFANPRLAAQFDVVPTAGWEDTLTSNTSLADSLIRAADDQLDLLALSREAINLPLSVAPSTLAHTDFRAIYDAYDLLVFDLGAFFDARSKPFAFELMRNIAIDVATAVTGPDATDPRDLASFEQALRERGCKFLGTIENRAAGHRAALDD
jgi:Mrp family chromosome partitioning ATPase